MARNSQPLKLEFSPRAGTDLCEIWEWNARHYAREHADRYVAFLKACTEKLCRSRNRGQPVPHSGFLRFALLRRRQRGYGHLVVFSIDEETFRVVRYFHTSQDWQTEMGRTLPE